MVVVSLGFVCHEKSSLYFSYSQVAVSDSSVDMACSPIRPMHLMPLLNVLPTLLAPLSLNTLQAFRGEFLIYVSEEVFELFQLLLCIYIVLGFLLSPDSSRASDNLYPATFFKVELNCKLEDQKSVLCFPFRDSSFGGLHNHLVL